MLNLIRKMLHRTWKMIHLIKKKSTNKKMIHLINTSNAKTNGLSMYFYFVNANKRMHDK